MRRYDDIGRTFGKLTCVSYGPDHITPAGEKHRTMVCACACGGAKTAIATSVRAGRTTSCGCQIAAGALKRTRHGQARASNRSGTYSSWAQMRSRCNDPGANGYQRYGGRGIKVCERWADFQAFLSDMGERPAGMSIDRVDVDGHYEPGNCRWASRQTQAENKRTARHYTAYGETHNARGWHERTGVHPGTLRVRIQRGWPVERAVLP
jgi:hypothetical protein